MKMRKYGLPNRNARKTLKCKALGYIAQLNTTRRIKYQTTLQQTRPLTVQAKNVTNAQ